MSWPLINSWVSPGRIPAWIYPPWAQLATTALRNPEAVSRVYSIVSYIAQATAYLIYCANAQLLNCCLLPPVCLISQVWVVFVSKQMTLLPPYWFTKCNVHLHFYLNNNIKLFYYFCAVLPFFFFPFQIICSKFTTGKSLEKWGMLQFISHHAAKTKV